MTSQALKNVVKLNNIVSVLDYGAKGDGISNDALAIQAANGANTTIFFPAGVYRIDSNVTLTSDVVFFQGAEILVPFGITLKCDASVVAHQESFSGDGIVSLDGSPTGYNLAWFKTANGFINERFDFAKRGMSSFNRKTVLIPPPQPGSNGTVTVGQRTFWQFNAPMIFSDTQNTMDVYVKGEFSAANNNAGFIIFDDVNKPESICFYGSIQASASASQIVNVGIDIKSGQRIQFYGNVLLNGFQTSVRIGSPEMTGAVGDIYIPMLQVSFFYVNAVLIWGESATLNTQGIQIGQLNATAAQSAGLSAVKIGGVIRTVTIKDVFYTTDVAKDGFTAFDAANVVEITSPGGARRTLHVAIDGIYQANANTAFLTTSTASPPSRLDIDQIFVRRIFGQFNQTAANINHCVNVTIDTVENNSDVVIGADASRTTILAYNEGIRTFTNNGINTTINGVAQQTRGGGLPPSPAVSWQPNALIRETSDNRIYMRVGNAGTAADFIMVRGALKGNTANRPTLTTTDIGQLYLDTTLDANGKPIWWSGTNWLDATGAVV